MNKSKIIAISAVSTALTVIVLVLGSIYQPLDLTSLFLASIIVMVPLSKGSILSAILTVIASTALALIFCAFRFQIVLPYALFFGLHPILNYIIKKRKYKKRYWFVLKDIWFVTALVLMQYFAKLFVIEIAFIQRFLLQFIAIIGAVAFFAYDYVIIKFQGYIDVLVKRLKL